MLYLTCLQNFSCAISHKIIGIIKAAAFTWQRPTPKIRLLIEVGTQSFQNLRRRSGFDQFPGIQSNVDAFCDDAPLMILLIYNMVTFWDVRNFVGGFCRSVPTQGNPAASETR